VGYYFNCADYFTPSTISLFGDGPLCIWNYNILQIILGYNALIVEDEVIEFVQLSDCNGEPPAICSVYSNDSFPLENVIVRVSAEGVSDVKAEVIAPWVVGNCEELRIISISRGGSGRTLTHEWEIPWQLEENLNCTHFAMHANDTNSSILRFSSDCLFGAYGFNKKAIMNFRLRISNWLDQSDATMIQVTYLGDAVPTVTIQGSTSVVVDRMVTNTISTRVSLPCDYELRSWYSYSWSQDSGPYSGFNFGWDNGTLVNSQPINLTDVQLTATHLVFPPYTLEYDTYYVFHLEVSVEGQTNNQTYVGVYVQQRPMPIPLSMTHNFISNQSNYISILDMFIWSPPRGTDAPLWWEEGKDVDTAASQLDAVDLLYSIEDWTCEEFHNGTDCDVFLQGLVPTYTAEEMVVVFGESGRFIFRGDLIRKMDNKVVNFTTFVDVKFVGVPEVVLQPAEILLSPGDQANFQLYIVPSDDTQDSSKTIVERAISPEEAFDQYFVSWDSSNNALLNEDAFSSYWTFAVLDASEVGFMTGSAELWVTVEDKDSIESTVSKSATIRFNHPPSSGKCTFEPKVLEIGNGTFRIVCSAWTDPDLPLGYTYKALRINDTGATEFTLSSLGSPVFEFELGVGVWRLKASISDRYGAVTEVVDFVEAVYSKDSKIYLENDPSSWLDNALNKTLRVIEMMDETVDISEIIQHAILVDTTSSYALYESCSENVLPAVRQSRAAIGNAIASSVKNSISTTQVHSTTSALYTIVRDPQQTNSDLVESGAKTLSTLINSLTDAKSQELIRKFPKETVTNMVDASTKMMTSASSSNDTCGMSLNTTNLSSSTAKSVWTSGLDALLGSLTDTIPGQRGYANQATNRTHASYATRSDAKSLDGISTSFASLPSSLAGADNTKAIDSIVRRDDFDPVTLISGSEYLSDTNASIVGVAITINMFDASAALTASKGRRRVDSSYDSLDLRIEDECEPITTAIEVTPFDSSIDSVTNTTSNVTIPLCLSTQGGIGEWVAEACRLVTWNRKEAKCSCHGIGSFTSSASSFFPEIGIFQKNMWNALTWDVIVKNPFSILCMLIFISLLIRLFPEVSTTATDMHLLVHDEIWADKRWSLVRKSYPYLSLKANCQKNIFKRWISVAQVLLSNHHPLFSLKYRATCTNYTGHQRLISLMCSLATALCMEAILYGQTSTSKLGEFVTQMISALLCLLVPLFCCFLFQNHNPGVGSNAYEKVHRRQQVFKLIRWCMRCSFLWSCLGKERITDIGEDDIPSVPVEDREEIEFHHKSLIWAASKGDLGCVKALLSRPLINPNVEDESGMFPLACAASNGHPNIVNALLSHPLINVNKQNKLGLTALMCAAFHGDLHSTTALLSAENIDITILNNKKKSALLLARERGNTNIAHLLEEMRMKSSWKNKCLFYCDCESEDSQTLHYRTSRMDYMEVSSDQWTSSDDSLNQGIMQFTPWKEHGRQLDKSSRFRNTPTSKSVSDFSRRSFNGGTNRSSIWSPTIMITKRRKLKRRLSLKKVMPPLKKKVNKTFDFYEDELAESENDEWNTKSGKKSFSNLHKLTIKERVWDCCFKRAIGSSYEYYRDELADPDSSSYVSDILEEDGPRAKSVFNGKWSFEDEPEPTSQNVTKTSSTLLGRSSRFQTMRMLGQRWSKFVRRGGTKAENSSAGLSSDPDSTDSDLKLPNDSAVFCASKPEQSLEGANMDRKVGSPSADISEVKLREIEDATRVSSGSIDASPENIVRFVKVPKEDSVCKDDVWKDASRSWDQKTIELSPLSERNQVEYQPLSKFGEGENDTPYSERYSNKSKTNGGNNIFLKEICDLTPFDDQEEQDWEGKPLDVDTDKITYCDPDANFYLSKEKSKPKVISQNAVGLKNARCISSELTSPDCDEQTKKLKKERNMFGETKTSYTMISDREAILFWNSKEEEGEEGRRRNVTSVSKAGARKLHELQQMFLNETLKASWASIVAWVCYIVWITTCLLIVVIYGVNFDQANVYEPTEEILSDATSNCSAVNEFTGVYPDVEAGASINLDLSVDDANYETENFQRYPEEHAPSMYDDDTPESYRFLAGAFFSWFLGVAIFSIGKAIGKAFVMAIWTVNERKKWKTVSKGYGDSLRKFANGTGTTIRLDTEHGIFLLLYNPILLLRLHDKFPDLVEQKTITTQSTLSLANLSLGNLSYALTGRQSKKSLFGK